jgi:hypothetical protein
MAPRKLIGQTISEESNLKNTAVESSSWEKELTDILKAYCGAPHTSTNKSPKNYCSNVIHHFPDAKICQGN